MEEERVLSRGMRQVKGIPGLRCWTAEGAEDERQKPQNGQGAHRCYLHGGKSGNVGLSEVGSERGREERTGRFLGEQEVQVEEEPARRWEDPCRGGHRDKRTWWAGREIWPT